jgi:hypothetical protein
MSARRVVFAALVGGSLAAGGAARADGPAQVRSTATVEVIDDPKQVDDIIARVRAQQAREQARPQTPASQQATQPARLQRPSLPAAEELRAGKSAAHREKREREREKHDRRRHEK